MADEFSSILELDTFSYMTNHIIVVKHCRPLHGAVLGGIVHMEDR